MYSQIDTKKIGYTLKKIIILLAVIYSFSLYNYIFENNTEQVEEISSSPSSPSSSSTSTSISSTSSTSSSILEDCNDKCKFLFPYIIPEQETKANLHIRSFIRLAESLDRILVIPNAGSSKFAASLPLSPTFYYDFNLLQKMFPNAKFVPQEEYKSWIKNQPYYKKITAEHILFTEERPQQKNKQNEHFESFVIAQNSSYYNKRMDFINRHSNKILYKFKMNIEKIKDIRVLNNGFLKSVNGRENFSKFMIKDLNSDSQIILIHSIMKQAMFPNVNEPIPYAEHIINEASKVANRLESSYIAIHWRMEGALVKNLPNCARELVKTIQEIRKDTGIKNVYLATDFPITCEKNGSLSINPQSVNKKAQSSTFHNVTFSHIKALEILISAIKDIKTWKSLNAFDYLNYIGEEKKNKGNPLVKELNGPGVQGILDKLVCINSNYFLSGPQGCCRVRSSYTRQIVKSRIKLLTEGNRNILNQITRWENY